MHTLPALPAHFRPYAGRDSRPASAASRYRTQPSPSRMSGIRRGVEETQFVQWRSECDAGLGEPRLLHPALQFNIRGGSLPEIMESG